MGSAGRLLLGVSIVWVPLAFLFDGVTVLMLPLRLGRGATEVGLISLLGIGVAAAIQPIAGWSSDRVRARIDRRAFLAGAAVPAIAGLWMLAGTEGIAAALVGYVVLQVGAAAMQAAQQTLIPEHVESTRQGTASGLKAAFDVGGAFIAFAVLAVLLASGDLIPAAALVTVLLAAAVATVLVIVPKPRDVPPARRWSFEMPAGLASLIASRFLFLFATYAVGRFLVFLVAERLGIAPERAADEAGWLLAALTLTTAVGAVPLGIVADRGSRRDLMVAGSLLAAAGIVTLVPPAGVAGLVAGGLLMSLGTAAFVTGNWTATAALVPPAEAGRLMGIANLGTGLAAAGAGALGPLIDASGFAPALLVAAAASVAAIAPLLGLTLERPLAPEKPT